MSSPKKPSAARDPRTSQFLPLDAFRDSFHANWVPAREITGALTSQAYRSEIVEALRMVCAAGPWETLERVCAGELSQGQSPHYADSGVPCLKTQDVQEMLIDDVGDRFVSESYAKSNDRLRISSGTVLINRSGAGSIGRAGVYLGERSAFTNEHVVRCKVSKPHDPAFVAAYLATWWGHRAIEQGISGSTGQLQLNQEQIRTVPIPTPHPDIQRAIGNKIRKAKELRERWKRSTSNTKKLVERIIDKIIPQWRSLVTSEYPFAWAKGPEIAERLDPNYYRANALAIRRALATIRPTVRVRDVARVHRGFTPTKVQDRTGAAFIVRFATITSRGLDYTRPQWGTCPPAGSAHILQVGDVVYGNAVHHPDYIGRDVDCFCWEPPFEAVASAKLNVIRPFEDAGPTGAMLCALLRHPIGRIQLQASVRAVTAAPSDAESIALPEASTSDRIELHDLIQSETASRFEAFRSIDAAARDVESLISGTLDVSALLAEGAGIEQRLAENQNSHDIEQGST